MCSTRYTPSLTLAPTLTLEDHSKKIGSPYPYHDPYPHPHPHLHPHLSQDHGKKICVIENEFGAINIDTGLVAENMKVPNPNPNPNPP